MKPTVIALLGRAGSGKSTAADYIAAKFAATRVSFAGPLKELAKHLLDLSDDQVYGTQEAKETPDQRYSGLTPRLFMQRLGNGARECLWKSIWVDGALNRIVEDSQRRKIASPLGGPLIYVIDDMRYVNEAEIVAADERVNAHIVKLVCTDGISSADPTHPSEAEVDKVPAKYISTTITSKVSPGSQDLKEKVDAAVRAFVSFDPPARSY